MAQFDETARSFIVTYVFPCLAILMAGRLFGITYTSIRLKTFAYVMNRMSQRINQSLGHEKRQLFSALNAQILHNKDGVLDIVEIGAGSGSNFAYYPSGTRLLCVDPNPYFSDYLRENVKQAPHVKLGEFIVAYAEDMRDIPDEFCDSVVCSNVLCTVKDLPKALSEIKRILKTGGMFYYFEHVSAVRGTWTYKIQKWIQPVWNVVGEGCKLSRETWVAIDNAGFSAVNYRKFPAPIRILIIKPWLSGTAIK